jgi:hydrogenase nickel incorporation protein HypA/HybF
VILQHFSSVGERQPKIAKGGKSDCFWPAAKPVWQCCRNWFHSHGWNGMHEVSIMEEAVRMAVEAAKSSDASRVLRLRLRVGTLSGAVPEAMRFAFDVVCRDTIAEGASLEIETVSAACWCATCGREFECADFVNECPHCHNLSGDLRRGRELEIGSVEFQ